MLMQHYYHARYPTDDWHLAHMFSLVFFSTEVCLVGVFPHSVSTWRDPCARVYVPLTLPPPLRKNKIEGVTRLPTWAKRGGIWTDAWVCLHYWVEIWAAGFFLMLQFMGCVIGRIHYGLKVVFCFRHFTASHYHHDAHVNAYKVYLVEVCLTCC